MDARIGAWADKQLLLDTKPVPVVGLHAQQAPQHFWRLCQLHYFGFKLVALTTLDGLHMVYDLVPANTGKRLAACVLWRVQDCDIFADKGFIGELGQAEVRYTWRNRIWTTKRANQAVQNTPAFDALLSCVRERIESTVHQLQNTGRHLERLLAKTVHGLRTRLVTKLAALTLRYLLPRRFNLDLLSFSISH